MSLSPIFTRKVIYHQIVIAVFLLPKVLVSFPGILFPDVCARVIIESSVAKHYGCKGAGHCGLSANELSRATRDFSFVKPGFHMIASIVRKTWDDRDDHMETLSSAIPAIGTIEAIAIARIAQVLSQTIRAIGAIEHFFNGNYPGRSGAILKYGW